MPSQQQKEGHGSSRNSAPLPQPNANVRAQPLTERREQNNHDFMTTLTAKLYQRQLQAEEDRKFDSNQRLLYNMDMAA